jgi:hypothetical protein
MNRRGFLKAAAGIASLPIVGKMASSVKSPMVREGIANVANVVSDAPVYFWKLVDKIRNLGKDVTETASTLDTQKVKQYKDYELTEDLTTGQIEIQRLGKQSDDAYINEQASEDVFMTYRPSEKILLDEANPAGGVQKTMPEYEEFTAYVSNNRGNTGEILEEVSGVPDDIFLEVGEQIPEFLRKGKADGGIINLAGGGRVNLRSGGIPKALQAAMQALKKKFGKDAIKTVEDTPEYFDNYEISPYFNIDRPESAIKRDKFSNFGKPGKFNKDGTVDYDYYAQILNDSENTFVTGDETIEELEFMLKEHSSEMEYLYNQYKTGKLDPVAGEKTEGRKRFLQDKLDEAEASGDNRLITRDEMDELESFNLSVDDIKQGFVPEEIDISQGMIDLDELNFTKNSEAARIKMKYPGISDDLIKKILIDDNPQRKAEVLATLDEAFKMMNKGKGNDEIIEIFKNTKRTKQASGGIIGLTSNPRSASNKAGVETLFKRR